MKINQYNKNKRLTYKDLETVFGIQNTTIAYRLKQGMTLYEALTIPANSYVKDLTGQKFGRLTPQYVINGTHKGNRKWHCLCDCGEECDVLQGNLTSGRQKSCGCLNDENRRKRIKDMSGKIINDVLIKERVENEIDKNGKEHVRYLCECPLCHSDFIARIQNIRSGNTRTCGCSHHNSPTTLIDLTGMDFEFCHVNKKLPRKIQPSGASRTMYECTCCCGRKYSDWAYTILHGRSNCGCISKNSLGELSIRSWLEDNSIPHSTQYWFNDLRSEKGYVLLFDFALFDINNNLIALIEYQGVQHYYEIPNYEQFGKMQREVTDLLKKNYCKQKSIKLFEIAYNENEILRIKEICNSLYQDNTVPSSQETA